jgi:hypothetical protein
MRVAAVISDLMLYSRIEASAFALGASLIRVDTPDELPTYMGFDLVLVDWSARQPSWATALLAFRANGARIALFGPHTDLEGHLEAKRSGIGPMLARSQLIGRLPTMFVVRRPT